MKNSILFTLSLYALDSFAGSMAHPNATVKSDGAFRGTIFCQSAPDTARVDTGRVHRESAQEMNAKEGGNTFCKGSTPIKFIKATFVSYDPKFEAGIAIDEVVDFKNRLKEANKSLAKQYFSATSRIPKIESCEPYSYAASYEIEAADYNPTQDASFFGLAIHNPNELDDDEIIRKYQVGQADLSAARSLPQLLWVRLNGNETAAVVPGEILRKIFFSAHTKIPELVTAPKSVQMEKSSLFKMQKKQRFWAFQGKNEIKSDAYPLTLACAGEACMLRANYIFADLPDSFRKEMGLSTGVGRDEETKKWTIRSAIRDSEIIWEEYMKKFTTVKEVAVPEEKLTRYEVQLDLEPYCRFALPRKDMVAQ